MRAGDNNAMITLVATDIYRGPEPAGADIPWIRQNIKTVIDLENDIETAELAPAVVLYNTITFLQIYSPWHAISVARLKYLVDLVSNVTKPVLVHCKHGEDRTGLVCAAYRVRVGKWTAGTAMTEALKFGYRKWLNFGLNKTWKEFCTS